jgi:16S rRNA (cytidine1402-2'-O)-methyltransferase
MAAEARAVVLYESPHRLLKLLGELAGLMPERRVFVGRELTKHFEECRVGTAAEVLEAFRGRTVKGELVLVLEPLSRKAQRLGTGAAAGRHPARALDPD